MASNQVKPSGNYVIMELTPATRYMLRISAHNNAGSSVAEYECATLTPSGGAISSIVPSNKSEKPDKPDKSDKKDKFELYISAQFLINVLF